MNGFSWASEALNSCWHHGTIREILENGLQPLTPVCGEVGCWGNPGEISSCTNKADCMTKASKSDWEEKRSNGVSADQIVFTCTCSKRVTRIWLENHNTTAVITAAAKTHHRINHEDELLSNQTTAVTRNLYSNDLLLPKNTYDPMTCRVESPSV